jgi:hypothetical protein
MLKIIKLSKIHQNQIYQMKMDKKFKKLFLKIKLDMNNGVISRIRNYQEFHYLERFFLIKLKILLKKLLN